MFQESTLFLLSSLVTRFFTSDINRSIAQSVKLLRAMIEERIECLRAHGKEGAEMPVRDFLSFVLILGCPFSLPE